MTREHRTNQDLSLARLLALVALLAAGTQAVAGPSWETIQQIKHESLAQAAQNAKDQQKTDAAQPISIPIPSAVHTQGSIEVDRRNARIARIELEAQPREEAPDAEGGFAVGASRDGERLADTTLRIELDEPLDMVGNHSGLAMTVQADEATSPEVRWGMRLHGENGATADVIPNIPLASVWGDEKHEIYFDWAYINYDDVRDALDVLQSVVAIEFGAAAAKRAPDRGAADSPRHASFEIRDLRLVDYLDGSFDPDRHDWGWDGTDDKDLTLQHRTQEVAGVVSRFGGSQGPRAATRALDMAARTQSWDGSFLDTRRGTRTITSGEYTHGFTLWGLMDAYEHLADEAADLLDEQLTIGPEAGPRRDFYQRMLYRGAMSRAQLPPSEYRDDIIHRDVLFSGANRVLGYAMMMLRAASMLEDSGQAKEVREAAEPIMDEVVDAQGRYSGGFPILAEGDRFDGEGIHYDAGYIRTHMDWLVIGIRETGDQRLIDIFDRYQEVVRAAMHQDGLGLQRMISERGGAGDPVKLVLPDAHAQIGLEHELPVMAQWGYNVSRAQWSRWKPGARVNHFTSRARARGYSLGAHTSILLADLETSPRPRDTGYRFPREFPVWSSTTYSKDGEPRRISTITAYPDGRRVSDFHIEVGEYLETVGVPVEIVDTDAAVQARAVRLEGWPTLLGADDELRVRGPGIDKRVVPNESFSIEASQPKDIRIEGPEQRLPEVAGGSQVRFKATLALKPKSEAGKVTLKVIKSVGDRATYAEAETRQ